MQRAHDGNRWVLRLDDGADLLATLVEIATRENWTAAYVVAGIGGVGKASIGYWNGSEYESMQIEEFHELVSLAGSIARLDGKPSVHLHAGLGSPSHAIVGGHVLAATIENLAEIYVEVFPSATWGRPMNESLGLRTLDLDPEPNP